MGLWQAGDVIGTGILTASLPSGVEASPHRKSSWMSEFWDRSLAILGRMRVMRFRLLLSFSPSALVGLSLSTTCRRD